MNKSYIVGAGLLLLVVGYILDQISGKVILPIKSPFESLNSEILSTYPLTAVSVALKSLGLILSTFGIAVLLKRAYLSKTIIFLITGILAELYARQQFAAGQFLLPHTWILTAAFAGIGFLLEAGFFFITWAVSSVYHTLSPKADHDVIWDRQSNDGEA